MTLNADLHKFLLHLERAQADGGDWVAVADVAAIPYMQREIAVRAGWVKQKSFGNLTQYKITAAGYSALGDNAETMIHRLRADNVEPLETPASDTRSHIRSLIQPVGDPIIFHAEEVSPAQPALEALVAIFGDAEAAAPVDPEISVSLYGETLGEDPVPAAPAVKTCVEPGCNEPRHLSYNRCQKHQQQKWRGSQTAQRDAAKPNRVRRGAPATQPHVATVVIDEPPFSDEDTQPDLLPMTDVTPSAPVDTPPRRDADSPAHPLSSSVVRPGPARNERSSLT